MPHPSMTIRRPRASEMVVLLLLPLLASTLSGCGGDPPAERATGVPSLPGNGVVGATLEFPPVTLATLGEHVEARARALAEAPYTPPDTVLPRGLAELGYSEYQALRFRPEAAVWRDEGPFELQFFHRGFLFPERVAIHVVDGDGGAPIPYDHSWFQFGEQVASMQNELPEGLGYAGFRVHYPLNDPAIKDELAVFLGASYFRLLGPGQVHGLSGRGIAVNTVGADREEFPDFREFWLVRPAPGDSTLVFHALLDGPSIAGAYRFELGPGPEATTLAVEAHLFARQDIPTLGVAPLTSMFLYGANRGGEYDDVRPRVHDSDGLMMHTSRGEWIWRPLSNRPALQVTSLQDVDPRGFGLAQRERDFAQYLDLEALYHLRPSQWVTTGEGWGPGGVQLVEITGLSEFGDNIVAYWLPSHPFRRGEERRYSYTIRTFDHRLPQQTLAQVERTVIGWDALPGQADPPPRSRRRFVVDFVPGSLEPEPSPGGSSGPGGIEAPVEAILRTSSGTVSDVRVLPLPGGGWRTTFRLEPQGMLPADLLLHLVQGEVPLSETWSYLWIPESDG